MADEIDVESFLDLLRQSELVSDNQMASIVAEFGGEGTKPESAQKLADELVKRGILTTWQAENLMLGKHRGFRLGPYRILRPLGQGGMSKVYLAEHEVMCRSCAIKILPGKYEEDSDLLNRFHLEARAVAALDHPNIVRAYDFNKDERQGKKIHYLVMEYVEGSDLRRMVAEQGPLDYRKAAEYVCQAADGLAHAHAAGFVHRDIKPANLLVDPHGVLKVLDLGLARFDIETGDRLAPSESSQTAVGTADYIAPEQVTDSRSVDGRADIYSLGLTFYFLLTGRRPFSKPTIAELLKAHQTEQPEPIGNIRPDVPLELEAIIDTMIAKSPFQRFQTAKELAEKLRQWLHDSGSGRGYSRISTLMAEALRAKQVAGQDPSRSKSRSTKDVDLELASLDDEPAHSRSTAGAKGGSSGKMQTGKDAAAAKESSSSAIRKMSASGGAKPAEQAEEAVLPSLKADLLKVPLSEAEMAAALPVEPLPTEATTATTVGQVTLQDIPSPKSRTKKKEGAGGFPEPSWALAGVAGVAIVVVAGALVALFGPWRAGETSKPVVVKALPSPPVTVAEGTQVLPPKPPPEPPKPPKPPSKSEEKRPAQPAPKQGKPSGQNVASITKTPSTSESKKATPANPSGETLTQSPKKELEKSVVKPQSPEPSPEKAIDPDELLAGMTNIWFTVEGADEKLKAAVLKPAQAIARDLKLTVVEKDAATMKIELKPSTDAGSSGLVISAELKCIAPNGKTVSVWKAKEIILSGDPTKMQATKGTLQSLNVRSNKFFHQFADAVRQARAKAPPE